MPDSTDLFRFEYLPKDNAWVYKVPVNIWQVDPATGKPLTPKPGVEPIPGVNYYPGNKYCGGGITRQGLLQTFVPADKYDLESERVALTMEAEWRWLADILDRGYAGTPQDNENYKFLFLYREATFDRAAEIKFMPGVEGAGVTGVPTGVNKAVVVCEGCEYVEPRTQEIKSASDTGFKFIKVSQFYDWASIE